MGETCLLHARKLLSRKGKMDMLVKSKVTQTFRSRTKRYIEQRVERRNAILNTHFYHHQRDLEKRYSIVQIISNIAYI